MTLSRSLCVLTAATVALGVAACGDDGAAADGPTRSVEAANGTIEVPAEPSNIAVLWQPTLAAVTQLGFEPTAALGDAAAEDSGLTPFLPEDYPVSDITIVSNSLNEDDIDVEALAETAPDVIIGASTEVGGQAELTEQLEAVAPTVMLEWAGTGSWRDHIYDVAEVLDAKAAADKAVGEYEDAIDDAVDQIEDAGVTPSETEASLVRLQSESEIRLETPRSFPGQVFEDLGFARPDTQTEPDSGTDFISESYENLDRGDGDVLFVFAAGGYEEPPETFSDGVWANLSAVDNEQLYAVDYDHWGSSNYYGAQRIIADTVAALTGELDPAL